MVEMVRNNRSFLMFVQGITDSYDAIFADSETGRCLFYGSCPTLDASACPDCVSADADCDPCNVPGICDDTVLAVDFVQSRDQCLEFCQETQVRPLLVLGAQP